MDILHSARQTAFAQDDIERDQGGYSANCITSGARSGTRKISRRGGARKSLRRSLREKSSNDMALPHPQSRKHHHRKEHKPGSGGIVRKSFKRTIDIAEYRNGKDDVDPANKRTLGGLLHD